ncbi:MAG: metallophosphoesterase, partial [Clostridia bacterium]|nr:metallophosphoesterase [Clostridia bacterium]
MKNEFTPVFRFVMCSDSHIEGIGSPGYYRLKKAIDYSLDFASKDVTYNKLDHFFIAGDITNKGSKEEFDAFKEIYDYGRGKGVNFLCTVAKGHDSITMGKESLEYYKSLTNQETDFHRVIGGYHFIGISTSKMKKHFNTPFQKMWLKKQLDEAVKDTPNKPVFVMHHEHVKYTVYGSYDEDVATGVVDLSGFANVTPFVSTSSGAIYPVIDLLNGSSAIENVIWFNSISAGTYGEMAGVVDFRALANASSLKTLTLTSPLTSIGQQAFQNCSNFVTLDLKGGVAADVTIATNAFSASPTFEALVYDETSKANLEAALTKAGYTTVTVTLVENEEPDVPVEPEEPATMPTGVTNTSDLWIDSGYTDVDTEAGWYMIGISNTNNKVVDGKYPALAYLEGGRFYWNKTTGEAVWLIPKSSTAISANYGEQLETAGQKNVLTDGVYFTMAWVFNKLRSDGYAFKCVEFRLEEGSTCIIYSTAGYVTQYMDAETILFDAKLIALALGATDRGLFMNNKALKTFDHVTFKGDG